MGPINSLKWYDRQWQHGNPGQGNWTLFALHFADPAVRASLNAIDKDTDPEITTRLASIRMPVSTHVLVL